MKSKLSNTIKTTLTVLVAVLITTTVVKAVDNLTPATDPTVQTETHYTLNDIYTKLTTGNSTSTKSGLFATPEGAPTASFRTLTEIYDAIPEWLTLSNATTTVEEGYYEAGDLATVDADLIAGNIKQGETIFGVEGTMTAGVSYPTEWSTEDPTGYVTWQAAMDYCDYLETDGSTVNASVQNIWHLPTYIELVNAYLTSEPGFQSGYCWSSTAYPYYPGYAYSVSMSSGDASYYDKTFPSNLARCAR